MKQSEDGDHYDAVGSAVCMAMDMLAIVNIPVHGHVAFSIMAPRQTLYPTFQFPTPTLGLPFEQVVERECFELKTTCHDFRPLVTARWSFFLLDL